MKPFPPRLWALILAADAERMNANTNGHVVIKLNYQKTDNGSARLGSYEFQSIETAQAPAVEIPKHLTEPRGKS